MSNNNNVPQVSFSDLLAAHADAERQAKERRTVAANAFKNLVRGGGAEGALPESFQRVLSTRLDGTTATNNTDTSNTTKEN